MFKIIKQLYKKYAARQIGDIKMEAVITVVGKDTVGILAKICTVCAQCNVNVEEVSQSILRGTFAMIMIVNISNCTESFTKFSKSLANAGKELGIEVTCTRQELYDAMHTI